MEQKELKMKPDPCPFCGCTDIRYSIKTTTISYKRAYHVTAYCNRCHCYGPRTLVKIDNEENFHRYDIEHDKKLEEAAYEAWNRRIY